MKNLNIPQVETIANNQFRIITDEAVIFKSYTTNIAAKLNDGSILLDAEKWNYSQTTSKYRNQFLNLTTKETEKMIASGEIKLVNLNN